MLVGLILGAATAGLADTPRVSVSQFVDHPALNAVLQGFKDDLKENGVEVQYREYNAHGNMGTVGANCDADRLRFAFLIVAIATPNAQACAKLYEKAPQLADTPMLFTAITDPMAAGLG